MDIRKLLRSSNKQRGDAEGESLLLSNIKELESEIRTYKFGQKALGGQKGSQGRGGNSNSPEKFLIAVCGGGGKA